MAGERAGEFAEVLAYHHATAFELAAALRSQAAAGLLDPAVRYLALAGEKTEPLDGGAAERYYSRAIGIIPEPTAELFRLMARRAAIVAMRNRAPEAVADFATAIAGFQEAGDIRAAADAMRGLSETLGLLGDLRYRDVAAAAEPLAAQALEKARDNPIRGVSAVYLVAAAAAKHGVGDDDGACALLEECEEVLRGKGDTVFVYLLPLAVRTALAAGNEDLGRRLAGVVVPRLPFSRHVDQALRAQVREMDDEPAEAAAAYAAAARGWHDFGIPYEEAQALLGRGRCLRAAGDRGAATEPLERAQRVFVRLAPHHPRRRSEMP